MGAESRQRVLPRPTREVETDHGDAERQWPTTQRAFQSALARRRSRRAVSHCAMTAPRQRRTATRDQLYLVARPARSDALHLAHGSHLDSIAKRRQHETQV